MLRRVTKNLTGLRGLGRDVVGERALAFGNAGGFIAGGCVGCYTYLKQHDAPEDIKDYHHHLCGRTMMAKTVLDLLHSLGVEDQDIRFDNFGG